MAKKTMHHYKGTKMNGVTVRSVNWCGRDVDYMATTYDPAQVTCKSCIRQFHGTTKRAVNGEGSIRQRTTSAEACAAVACSDDPYELVRVAFEHWDNIGWPEDKGPVSLLKRALDLLSC